MMDKSRGGEGRGADMPQEQERTGTVSDEEGSLGWESWPRLPESASPTPGEGKEPVEEDPEPAVAMPEETLRDSVEHGGADGPPADLDRGAALHRAVDTTIDEVGDATDMVVRVLGKKLDQLDARGRSLAAGVERRVERLSRDLERRISEVEAALERFPDDIAERASRQVGEQVAAALIDVVKDLRLEVRRQLAMKPSASMTRLERQLSDSAERLRKDVAALATRIDGWGKPRTAPRLAKDVTELRRRVDGMERGITAAAVDEIERAIDERLDAMIEAVVRRLHEEGVAQQSRKGGVFRRGR